MIYKLNTVCGESQQGLPYYCGECAQSLFIFVLFFIDLYMIVFAEFEVAFVFSAFFSYENSFFTDYSASVNYFRKKATS